GYVRALGDLLGTLEQGLLDPADLARLDVPERVAMLARTLAAARTLLDRAGVVEPHRAVRIAVDRLAEGIPSPSLMARAGRFEFAALPARTPPRLGRAAALASGMRAGTGLPWSADRAELIEPLEPALRALERLGSGPAPEVELF